MTRSARAGGAADIPPARVRFACEAVFLVLVAVGAALIDLRPLAIIILIGCALLLVALIERASSRQAPGAVAEEGSDDVSADPLPTPAPEPDATFGPAVTKRPLDLPGLEEPPPRPAPPPQPRFLGPRQPPPPPAPPPVPAAREWNLWDLERRAREQAGNAPRDEEWNALFTHLRVFANADGELPKEFDELVRESFGTLIEAA